MKEICVSIYTTASAKQPFVEWLMSLEVKTRSIVLARLGRLRCGNMGDCKAIRGSSIFELRIDYGPGYRVYCGKKSAEAVVLLLGGNKKTQRRDIEKAKKYWLEYEEK